LSDKVPRRLLKATMEACFTCQEKLRKHLDNLIEKNRPIKDATERDLFMREFVYSTLGLGLSQKISYKLPSKDITLIRNNLEVYARWLSYQKTSMVKVPVFLYSNEFGMKNEVYDVEIKDLWECLLDNLFSVFPLAIDRACSMSKERDEQQRGKGYSIGEE